MRINKMENALIFNQTLNLYVRQLSLWNFCARSSDGISAFRSNMLLLLLFLPLSVVTVFLGILIYKDELGLDDSPLYAMIVYCVGVAFVIAFDIYLSCKKRDHKTASFTMTGEKEGESG